MKLTIWTSTLLEQILSMKILLFSYFCLLFLVATFCCDITCLLYLMHLCMAHVCINSGLYFTVLLSFALTPTLRQSREDVFSPCLSVLCGFPLLCLHATSLRKKRSLHSNKNVSVCFRLLSLQLCQNCQSTIVHPSWKEII